MRLSNEEFTNEVFRRSDQYIAKRKKRNRVMASCIPLVLCVSILGVWRLSGIGGADESAVEMETSEDKKNSNMAVDGGFSPEVNSESCIEEGDNSYKEETTTVPMWVWDDTEITGAYVSIDDGERVQVSNTYMPGLLGWLNASYERRTSEVGEESLSEDVVHITFVDAEGVEIEIQYPIKYPSEVFPATEEEHQKFLQMIDDIVSK